jgi:hypothetical protein
MEKKGDTGVYGKKLHANQSDVLNVQDVGKNQTFNQIISGSMAGGGADGDTRKNQIKMKRDLLAKDRAAKRRNRHQSKEKNNTKDVYNELKAKMGERYNMGYSTSEDDSQEDIQEDLAIQDEADKTANENIKPDSEEVTQMMLEDAIVPRNYILSARSKTRFYWDVLIIIFAIQNAITLPLDIAFSEDLKDFESLKTLDDVTIVLFAMDIVICFFTSYINVASGDEIYGLQMIAVNYVCSGTFIIDILSTFPLDRWVEGFGNDAITTFFKIFGFLKM